jgi:hypothetical protein
MFERFWKNSQESHKPDLVSEKLDDLSDQELADMIERVQEQTLGTASESSEKSTSNNVNKENKHPVKTGAEVEKEMQSASNPHGFTEMKH